MRVVMRTPDIRILCEGGRCKQTEQSETGNHVCVLRFPHGPPWHGWTPRDMTRVKRGAPLPVRQSGPSSRPGLAKALKQI